MKTFQLTGDITVFYVQAASFPLGVQAAFDELDAKLEKPEDRLHFGLSHGSKNGDIVYRAAVREDYAGEGSSHGCESLTLREGTYRYEDLKHWRDHKQEIGGIFKNMLTDPRLDMTSPCVERYDGDSVRCMVRLQS